MQKKLKSVSKSIKIKTIILFYFCFTYLNYSQVFTFNLNDKSFEIVKDNEVIYKDSTNFYTGICNDIQILKSDFKNQFYLYIENECTQTKVKQLFKINWVNNKFSILSKEIIKRNQNTISGKIIYYDNYFMDSLLVEKLDVEEKNLTVNYNKKNNKIPVYYKEQLIGNRNISTDKIIYDYPIIDTYDQIDDLVFYNNIAFILSQNKIFDEAIYLLNEIIKIEPNRVVAYLNIADCFWETNEKEKAVENYKFYIELMKKQKKDLKKIPKYVFDRIEKNKN